MNMTIEDCYWDQDSLTRFTEIIKSIFNYQCLLDYQKEYNKLAELCNEKLSENALNARDTYTIHLNNHIKELHQILAFEAVKNYKKDCPTAVFRTIECIKYTDAVDGKYADAAKDVFKSISSDARLERFYTDFSEYGKCSSTLINKDFLALIEKEAEALLSMLEDSLRKISAGTCKAISDYLPKDFVKFSNILMWYYAIYDSTVDRNKFKKACSFFETFTTLETFVYSQRRYVRVCSVEETLAKALNAKSAGISSNDTIEWVNSLISYCASIDNQDLLYHELVTLLSGLSWMGAYRLERDVMGVMVSNSIPMPEEINNRYQFLCKSSDIREKPWSIDINSEVSFESDETEKIIYNYELFSMSDTQVKEYFDSLSTDNKTELHKLVVFEWSKSLNVNSGLIWDINNFQRILSEVLIEEIDENITCKVISASVYDGDNLEWDDVIYISEREEVGRFPWLGFIIIADRITRKQMSVAVYAVYIPEKDSKSEISIIENNNQQMQKYLSIRNKRNPKIKNFLVTMHTIIVKEMEKYLNSESDSESIY